MFELVVVNKDKVELQEKPVSYYFRWSYNSIESTRGAVGTPKASHVNYIFIRLEFILINGKRIILGKELNQWNSAPANWEYGVLIAEGCEFIGITSHDLVKLKKEMELLSTNHK